MNTIFSLFFKAIIFLGYKKEDYIFHRSKKFITSWGEGSYGSPRITCFDGASRLSVGKYVSIADQVAILLGSNHRRGLVTTYPWSRINQEKKNETNERGDVHIGNDVWIGFRTTIIGPVTIGDGAIVGAGAVVVNDIPAYAVAVGVPARVVKYRFDTERADALLKIKWWDWDRERIRKAEGDIYSKDVSEFLTKYAN